MKSGKSIGPDKPSIQLTERDRAILEFVREHGAAWFDVLYCKFFPDGQPEMARSTLRRLCGTAPHYRFLRPQSSMGGAKAHYQLTFAATRLLGCSPARSRPLGAVALARRYALQWFLFLADETDRVLLDGDAIKNLANTSVQALLDLTYYIAGPDDQPHLGILTIDHGGSTQRIVRKLLTILSAVAESGALDRFIQRRALNLTVLTVSEGKKRSVAWAYQRRLAKLSHPSLRRLRELTASHGNIDLHVWVVPGLDQLVFSNESQS